MKTLQRIGILFLLMVFLLGTTGISIFEHICSCKGQTLITLYPEIFDRHSSCCCSEAEVEVVSPDHAGLCCLESSEHCKSVRFFLKANIAPAPIVVNVFSFHDFAEPLFHFTAFYSQENDEPAAEPDFQSSASPPISGRERVFTFHQPKIPALRFFLS